ncbi:MAG: DUF1489 family protein [Rhizobiales bacterium]|nr:DUF1489 family protein [Hyphomicrobiales bacterium]
MTVHLIKLCVGGRDVEDLRAWQTSRASTKKRTKGMTYPVHVTRMSPTRVDELLDGGSLYWVMKGHVRCRQRLVDIETFVDAEGVKRCKLVLDPEIVVVQRREKRPFQGWRYYDAKDVPPDAASGMEADDMPDEMREELEALGLL